MDGQDEGGRLGDLHHIRCDVDALFSDPLNLGHESPGIDHDAITDNRKLAANDTRGEQGEFVDLLADNQRMARIMAALETRDDIGAMRQPVNQLALAFIAPLGAYHGHIGHENSPEPVRGGDVCHEAVTGTR